MKIHVPLKKNKSSILIFYIDFILSSYCKIFSFENGLLEKIKIKIANKNYFRYIDLCSFTLPVFFFPREPNFAIFMFWWAIKPCTIFGNLAQLGATGSNLAARSPFERARERIEFLNRGVCFLGLVRDFQLFMSTSFTAFDSSLKA